MEKVPKLTVVVCTYNRSEILKYCLDSLEKQSSDKSHYEVIVVDNNSTDKTKEVVEEYCRNNNNFRYVFEPVQGLSSARNRGWKEAKADWIAYIDDDAYVKDDFTGNIFSAVNFNEFDMFGGVYLPWYKYGKPKWFRDEYASNLNKKRGKGLLSEGEYADGGIMVLKKSVFVASGGFNNDLGMKGDQTGYGEETEFQKRLRINGFSIGFVPEIIIYHLVPEYKLKLKWFVRSSFINGLSSVNKIKDRETGSSGKKTEILKDAGLYTGGPLNFFIVIVSVISYNAGRMLSLIRKKVFKCAA